MGIVAVIARAKKSVQTGGLPGVVEEFGGTLRSRAIPAPLRPAAARIADLLRVPERAPRAPVSLVAERAPHAVDGLTHAGQAGVCPFTGSTAEITQDAAELASSAQVVEETLAAFEPAIIEPAVVVEVAVEEVSAAPEVSAAQFEPAREPKAQELPVAAESVSAQPEQARAAALVEAVVAEPVAKAKIKDEKVTVEVAAKSNTAKTAPRSNKNSGGKSGNKKSKKK